MSWPRLAHAFVPVLALVMALAPGPRSPLAQVAGAGARDSLALARADSLARSGAREASLAVLREIERDASARGDRHLCARALTGQAEQFVRLGRPRDAEAPARRAVRLAGSMRDTVLTLQALRWLAVSVGNQGRGAEMAEVWGRALVIARRSGILGTQGFAHLGIGYHELSLGKAQAALAEFQSARELFLRAGDPEWAAWALLGMGQAYDFARDDERSRECYRRVVAEADPKRNPGLVASASNNLAVLEFALGDPAAAAAAFRAAYATERDPALLADRITEGTNLAICQGELGQFGEASALLDTLLRLSRERGFRHNEAKVLLERGDVMRRRGWLHESARCLREALDLSSGGLLKDQVESATGLARTLAETDSLPLAEEVVADLARRAAADTPFPFQAELDLVTGELHVRAGRAAQAVPVLARAELGARERGLERDRVSALVWLGRALRATGRPDSAMAVLLAARTLWEHARDVMRDPEWREVYGAQSRALHGTLIELTLEGAELPPVAGRRTGPGRPASAATPSARAADRTAAAFDALQRYKARTLQERMLGPWSTTDTGSAATTRRTTTSLRDLQQQVLREGECWIEAFSGADTTLLFAVTADSLRVAGLPAGLAARTARWRHALATPPGREGGPERRAALALSATRLGDEILAPFSDLVRTCRVIFFCPDGELNLVPFSLLVSSHRASPREGSTGPVVTIAPSATVLARLRAAVPRAAPEDVSLLAVAASGEAEQPALPGATAEVRWLAARFANVHLREGAAAGREPPGAPDLAHYQVLHFAAHATTDDQRPWRSGVRVGASPPADPYLRASQIASSPLEARLVVLAGCESAGGRVLSGEGVQGLAAAFLSAGAPAVVASLWPVDDAATASLVREFYGRLARGRTVAAALAEAQAALRARPATTDPFYWAGFVVIGEPQVTLALRERARRPWAAVALGAAALAGLVVLAWPRRGRDTVDSA